MSLVADIAAHGHTKGPRCSVAVLLDSMTAEDRAELVDVLEQERFAGSDICRALRARGIDIASDVVSRHRRKDCKCPR